MILETPLDEAWATLSTLAPARGTLAGHTGTAMLEEADDDTHRRGCDSRAPARTAR